MGKTPEVKATELLEALSHVEEEDEIGGYYSLMVKPSSMITGSSQDLRDAQGIAMRLARDFSDMAVRLNAAIRSAESNEKLEKLK